MTENDRNIRTLIVCFVMAMMALVPLRMMEVGQTLDQTRVLGETEEISSDVVVEEVDEMGTEELMMVDEESLANGDELVSEEAEEVVLPNADLE